MITRVSEVIRGWLGWCPNAQPRMHSVVIQPEDNSVIPSARGIVQRSGGSLARPVQEPDDCAGAVTFRGWGSCCSVRWRA